jgi:Glycosyl transferase family 64 domain
MDQYMNDLPNSILDTVAHNFNCEDVAMSFLISARTDGQPSLLADYWAMKSLVKLYVAEKISGTDNHKTLRDDCVENFGTILGLKDDGGGDNNEQQQKHFLQTAKLVHSKHSFFQCGAEEGSQKNDSYTKSQREIDFDRTIESWHTMDNREVQENVRKLMSQTGYTAYKMGLIANTDKWKEKFQKED